MMEKLRNSFFLFFMLQTGWALAQPSGIDLSQLNKYTQSDFYYLLYSEHVNIALVKGAIITTTNTNKIFCYNDYKNTGYSSFDIVYNSAFSEIKNLNVVSYVLEKGKYKKREVKEFTTANYSESSMFEDSYKEISFTMPSVNKGTIGQIQYDDVNKEPHFSSTFYFKQFVPIARNEFVVEADQGVEIAYRYIGDSSGISFSKIIQGNKAIYTWTAQNLETFKQEDYMPKLNRITSQVVCWVKSTTSNGKQTLINNDISSFSCWIYGLCENVFKSPLSDDAKKFVDSLKQQGLSSDQLGSKIFRHVQKDIKYIAFEGGLHGYIPRKPSDVYLKRFGDCKDKATLLSAMLNYAGIESRLALVGTTDLVYKFSELPIPECANHMITAVKINGSWTITDATDEYVSWLSVPESLQGKEALILIDSATSFIHKIPEMPYYKNGRIDSLEISMKGMQIIGKGKSFFVGYLKENVLAALESLNEEKLKEFYMILLNIGNNKCEYLNVARSILNDTTLLVSYDFKLPSYMTQFENKFYLNPHLLKARIDDYGVDSSKKYSVQFKFLSFTRSVLKVNLEDMTVDHLPQNSTYKHDKFGFGIDYQNKGSHVLVNLSGYSNMMELAKPDFSAYEVYFASLRKSILDNISFYKK